MIFVKISEDFNKSRLKFALSHRFQSTVHIVKLLRYYIYCNKAPSLINAPLPFLWEKGYQIAIQIGFKTLKFSQDIEIFVYLPTFYLENVILGLLNCSANGRILE